MSPNGTGGGETAQFSHPLLLLTEGKRKEEFVLLLMCAGRAEVVGQRVSGTTRDTVRREPAVKIQQLRCPCSSEAAVLRGRESREPQWGRVPLEAGGGRPAHVEGLA
eukprot:scaffold40419_cov36-Tisochrysis_lutea.AAC.1